jgi:hypothetical protein
MNGLTEFEQLVKDMRYYQSQYFRYRENRLLEMSKQLEMRVDHYLKEKEDNYRQPNLFGGSK